jgi:hypothetical protein
VCLFLLNSTLAAGTQTAASSPQPQVVLQQSLSALVGSATLSDVTLSGSARRIAGSDDESGTVTLKALASGATRLDFSFPSGPRSELRGDPSKGLTGHWSGPDGIVHTIANHNLITDWSWFPAFALANAASSQNAVVAFVDNEVHNDQSVVHLSASLQSANPSGNAALARHLSQIDLFLDATTLLPAAIDYNIHPDNNALLDIPVELRFSGYAPFNGAKIPFHVQKFINNNLVLDIEFQTASLNTGLSSSSFSVQ